MEGAAHWIFNRVHYQPGSHKSDYQHYDVYLCSACGAEHHVGPGALPILPFCWECKARMDIDQTEEQK